MQMRLLIHIRFLWQKIAAQKRQIFDTLSEGRNIDIDDIDDYLIEKEVFETSFTNLFDMLKEASYNNIIVNNLKQKGINPNIEPNNALILIYNYQFDSNTLRTINTEFIATVEYK